MSKLVDCPRCGGYPDLDEVGRAYACYFCFDEGKVTEDVVLAIEAAERDFAEKFAPKALGVFAKAIELDDDYDPPADKPGRGLFTRLVQTERPAPVFDEMDLLEDCPF